MHASRLGTPLNVYTVLNLDLAPSEVAAQHRFAHICELCRKWLEDHGAQQRLIYVWEWPKGASLHVNLLIHIPDGLKRKWRRMLTKWIKIRATSYLPRVAHAQPIWNWDGLFKYVIKGSEAEARRRHDVPKRYSSAQGRISFKRVGVSRCLGAWGAGPAGAPAPPRVPPATPPAPKLNAAAEAVMEE